jgi:hypothetical protein
MNVMNEASLATEEVTAHVARLAGRSFPDPPEHFDCHKVSYASSTVLGGCSGIFHLKCFGYMQRF